MWLKLLIIFSCFTQLQKKKAKAASAKIAMDMTLEQGHCLLNCQLTGISLLHFMEMVNLLSTANALSKNEAKAKAAAEALKYLLFRDIQIVGVVHHWDAMAASVYKRVGWVMDKIPSSVCGWNVLAAFCSPNSKTLIQVTVSSNGLHDTSFVGVSV